MNRELLDQLLKTNPQRTRWEYVNFLLEPYGEFTGRAILSQLYRLKEINEILEHASETSAAVQLAHEQLQITAWLATMSQEEIAQHLAEVEAKDPDYWVQRLGREAAVDMVSTGRISKATLDRAILLDETRYREFARVSNTILQVVGDVTRDVEHEMGIIPPQLPQGEPR